MIYAIADLVKEIRIVLEENTSSEALAQVDDVDTLSLDELVKSKIEDAARLVLASAPLSFLDGGKPFGDTINWDMATGYGSGTINLPDDFLRLIVFQMSDWSMPVVHAIDADSPLYSRQHSRYAGVRGNPQRPVVAITQQSVGNVLEFFSCTQGANVYIKQARYEPIPKMYVCDVAPHIGREEIELPDKTVRAIIYCAAYLVELATGSSDQANAYLATSEQLIKE